MMDATILAVIGTGLTAIGTGVALFAALWRAQGNRFDTMERHIDKRFEAVDKQFEAVDKRFEAVDKRWTERFDMAEKASRERFEIAENANRERFDMAERANRERLEAMDARWTERFEAMDRRFETAERQNEAAHAAICGSIARLDERTRADAVALHQRFDGLNGRFDDLYRHLLGERAKTDVPGHAPASG